MAQSVVPEANGFGSTLGFSHVVIWDFVDYFVVDDCPFFSGYV
jgi:hypothetical protein